MLCESGGTTSDGERNDRLGVCPITTVTTATANTTSKTATTTTTTIYDPDNVGCVEEQDPCTVACETKGNRNYQLIKPAVKLGKVCIGSTDCLSGEDACKTPITTIVDTPTTTTNPLLSGNTAATANTTETPNFTNTGNITLGIKGDANLSSQSGRKSNGVIAGILVALVTLGTVIYFLRQRSAEALRVRRARVETLELEGTNMMEMEVNPLATLIKMKKEGRCPTHNFQTTLDEMVAAGRINAVQARDRKVPREITRDSVELVSELGSGQFGAVWKGLLDESKISGTPAYLVAVKVVKDEKMKQKAFNELIQEAAVMAQIGHHDNLVSLIGVHTTTDEKMIVLSICEHGDLLSLLETKSRDGEPIDNTKKLMMMTEVSRGMSHLAAKGFVHRDLAARNVLLSENSSGMVCKIADFGLARALAQTSDADDGESDDAEDAMYYRSQGSPFAVRWTAPESMTSYRFDEKSDVWSMGVTMCVAVLGVGTCDARGCPCRLSSTFRVVRHQMKSVFISPTPHLSPLAGHTLQVRMLCKRWQAIRRMGKH
jgi:ephrin-B